MKPLAIDLFCGLGGWTDGLPRTSSKGTKRKAASAMIAKIPLPLSQHIARTYKPKEAA